MPNDGDSYPAPQHQAADTSCDQGGGARAMYMDMAVTPKMLGDWERGGSNRNTALKWALAFHAGKTQNFTIVLETAKAFEAYLDGVE